ncbi:non-ribosomal peptide synthetase [Pseudomonas poae]|uniref:Non-ribosomal peptide synthetase n=1 Tax=Pseudomonas poae TaxID=200451 RepID=A0A2S9EGF7_9PSED|nr:non-ribosomal peptide synthetase [Pseudomonas poae]PRA33150.1 non-ribosomal peptide synthetase [Pseudomonas poae]PRC14193.1 non-ribosomal peptide synthetase [Pseudomonas poae]
MNAEDSLKLARRFIGLPLEKRQLFLQALQKEGVDFSRFPIPAGVEAEDRQALSYAQQRMWFLWQLDPASGAYNLPGAVRLKGALNLAALEQAFASLVARHETLRTVFQRQEDERLLQVAMEPSLAVDVVDFSALAADEREHAVDEAATRQSMMPFDLQNGPLLRVQLLKLDAQEHVLLLTLHHIVSDGWSMNVLIEEFIRCYDAHERNEAPQLPPLPIQYSDYALWQRRWLEAGEQARQLEYWQARLGQHHPVLELPTDHARPAMPSYRGTRHTFAVDAGLVEQLRACAQQHHVTLFMLLLGAFNVLLHRYTGQADIRVGVPIANRNRGEVEGLIGFFVNTQVLRTELNGQTRVDELLRGIKEAALGAQAHQDLPFERLVEALNIERSLSHTPLFQVMYNHQPQVADISTLSTASGLELSAVQGQGRTTQFDLTLDTYEQSGTLHAALTYADDLFDPATIERMAGHWLRLLQGMVADSQQAIGELPLLDPAEYQRIVHDWNPAHDTFTQDLCIHQRIADQVAQQPQALAVTFGTRTLSYQQLDQQANQLAHLLVAQGVGPEVRVGVAMARSEHLLVALLAVLKAGGAYVPLDPDYPAERVAYMLEDSRALVLLTEQAVAATLPVIAGTHVILLDEMPTLLAPWPITAPASRVAPDNLAYVIYTSGSTGKPKGVAIAHRNVLALIDWTQRVYRQHDLQGVLASTSVCFDLSVWELFVTLALGGSLIIARNALELPDLPARDQVRLINTVPSAIAALQRTAQIPSSVRIINLAGEPLKQTLVELLYQQPGVEQVFDLYGPSEDTTYSTFTRRTAGGRASIGRPITHTAGYVLDAELQAVPQGVAAELYLAGAGITRGYLGRAALTAERYVPNPFATDGERLYRTGDLVRYQDGGVMEYQGRIDHQVKVRGFRIELGEIEARLLQQEAVRELAVLAQDSPSGQQLVAWIVPASAEWLEDVAAQETLREHLKAALKQVLPAYMVPNHLLFLSHLPLTPNGKLDRKALPAIESSQPPRQHAEPRSAVEKALAVIWQDVLGLETVGLDDNFFELGGDSIVSMQVVSRARQASIGLSPKDVFQHQTVRSLAQVADQRLEPQAEQGLASGAVALGPVQQWFFAQDIPQRQHWNQSLLLVPREPVIAATLEAALQQLVRHHDGLRLSVRETREGWQQRYAEPSDQAVLWQRQAHSDDALTDLCTQAQRSLDLQEGPLLRALLVDMPDHSQRLLLAIHHLAVDGVSWRVVLEDLQRLYTGAALASKTTAYQDWTARLQASVPRFLPQLAYWQQSLQGASSRELPCDNPQGALYQRLEQKVTCTLDADTTRQLLAKAPAAYRTQVNDLLLTALARVVCRWSGQGSTLIQLEGHGREDLFDGVDLTRTVGWFTSLFPVNLTPADGLSASIKAIKEQLRSVPDKGVGYGVLRYLAEPDVTATLAGLAQPRITFNYLGQFDRQFDEHALFTPSAEGNGLAQDPQAPLANWLTVEGQVYGGQLALSWGFSREMFQASTIQQLADDYAVELQHLIEHCCATPDGQVTPSDFPLANLTQQQLDDLPVAGPAIADLYPLSPMQQGMLFHTLYAQGDDTYVNQLAVEVEGLDVQRFREAWQATLEAHDILRSGFIWQNGGQQPLQLVQRSVELPLSVLDWRELSAAERDIDGFAAEDRRQGFDLAQAPLMRLTLIRLDAQRYHLIYTNHHILMDGWSNAQLLAQMLARYAGEAPTRAPVGYRQYIDWLQRQDDAASEAFWRERLGHLDGPTLLASALPRQDFPGQGYAELDALLEVAATTRLTAFARAQKVTVNTLVQAAWLLLLQRYTGQRCVTLGTTVSGRPAELPGIEEQIGLFINTLPLIAEPQAQQSVGEWIQQVQGLNLALREHEHTPLYDIQRWAGSAGEALFDSILVFENFPVAQSLQQGAAGGLRFGAAHNHEQTNYPLALTVFSGERLSLSLGYQRERFDEPSIHRLLGHLRHVLEQFARDPGQAIGALPLLLADEYQAMVHDWNPPHRPLAETCVHQTFEARVVERSAAPALILDEQQLSYAQLNEQANQLAHKLRELGVGPDVLVGVAVGRSLEMIIGLLAILKAGGAYVPLDPEYPTQRLGWMIEDSGLQLLLTQSPLQAQLPIPAGVQVLCLDTRGQWLADYPTHNPDNLAQPTNLAYVMFTSGSTGRPKGVGINHGSVARHVEVMQALFKLTAEDRVLQFGTFNFDGFVEQLYPALCQGACVVLRGGELWDSATFYQQVMTHGISVADLTTAYWHMLARDFAAAGPRSYGRLRQVHAGGEAMPPEGLHAWQQAGLGHIALYNTYGPTEATVTATALDCADYVSGAAALPLVMPIGQVLDGRSIYLVDDALNPVPVGVVGELLIGGELLARGYFNRPALSAEKFIPDPFGSGRVYRTGDLARYRADGVIEYVGRADHQVKIRGFRIELGEIEARVQEYPGVREALVMTLEGPGGLQVAAWLVPYETALAHAEAEVQNAWREGLRAHLKALLPDYMVPTHLTLLGSLPLSPNGKLDRKALPLPDLSQGRTTYQAPLTPVQRQLAAIWEQVLQVPQVGLGDHFFELGGHSLLATRVVSCAHAEGLDDLRLRDLFECTQLGALAERLEQRRVQLEPKRTLPALVAQPRAGVLPLSLAQQRLWLVERISTGSAAYNLPAALTVRGELDLYRLQRSFAQLMDRHEILRTSYHEDEDGNPLVRVTQQVDLPIRVLDISDLPVEAQQQAQQQWLLDCGAERIDLEQVPLLRVHLLRRGADEHLIFFAMHHIISDGWSMAVLVQELLALYAQATPLAPLPVQYLDYAFWQQRLLSEGWLAADSDYWRDNLHGAPACLPLPHDFPRPAQPSHDGDDLAFQLPAPLYQSIKTLAQELGCTPYLLMLAAFQLMLHRTCDTADLVIGTDIAGRQQQALEGLIGFFVNVLPMRSRMQAAQPFSEYVHSVSRNALQAFEHQELPLDLIIEACAVERIKGINPLIQVLFVMNNTPNATLRFDGLELAPLELKERHSKFEMGLFVEELGNSLVCNWSYAVALFRRESIERMMRSWIGILEQAVQDRHTLSGEFVMSAAQQVPATEKVASKKFDKLNKFLKKGPAAATAGGGAQVRFAPLRQDQVFPLLAQPVDSGLDVIEWVRNNRALVEEKLASHASILFRGFALNGIQEFEQFAEALQPGLYGNYGDLPKKDGGKNTYRSTPYPEKKMILFHNESAHQDRWPRKQMFYCELPSPVGGATPIVDCREMCRRLPADLLAKFESKGLLYVRTFTDKLDVSWRHFFKTDSREEVEARCRAAGIQWQWLDNDELQTRTHCPAVISHPLTGARSFFNQVQLHHIYCLDADVRDDLIGLFGIDNMPRHVYYGDGTPIEDEVMELVGQLYEECAVRFDWQQGDVVLMDNMLAAHARDPFEGPRKIVVAMGDMFERADLKASAAQARHQALEEEVGQ